MKVHRLALGDEEAARGVVELKYATDDLAAPAVTAEEMRGFLADGSNYLLAAYHDDKPVGFVLAYRLRRIDGARYVMFLYEIGVLEKYRRRGIGRILITELTRLAKEGGCIKMFVPTSRANAPAMALYAATGGTEGDSDATGFWWNW